MRSLHQKNAATGVPSKRVQPKKESAHGALDHDLHAAVLTPARGRAVTRHRFGRGVTVGLDSVRRNGVLDEDGFHGLGPELGELHVEFGQPGRVGVTLHEDLPVGGAGQRLTDPGEALAGASDRKILVEGHTDSTGSAEFNMKLSELRAESVKAVLVENAVSPDRIETHGYASTKPVASNGTPAGRSQNRRVEVVVQGAVR